jgi:hypothetical protein
LLADWYNARESGNRQVADFLNALLPIQHAEVARLPVLQAH